MTKVLDLNKMSREEKLIAMESLWADLSQNGSRMKSPTWHGDVLAETERLVKSGKVKFASWDEAKARIRRKASKVG